MLSQPLSHADVEGVYAGLRPLLTGESEGTSQLSREHTVAVPVPGLVAVAGGKYTTYRVMARDAVDAAARGLDAAVPPSATHVTPARRRRGLPGAVERPPAPGGRERAASRADRASAEPLRLPHRRAARRGRPAPGARQAARRHRGLPVRRGLVRRGARGGPPPRRRPRPAHAHLDRDVRSRPHVGRAGRAADGRGARLVRRADRARGRRSTASAWPRSATPRSSPTTRPPTLRGRARRSSRSAAPARTSTPAAWLHYAPLAARTASSSATSRGSSGASIGSAEAVWLKVGKSRWPQPRSSLSSWWKAPSTVSTRPGT